MHRLSWRGDPPDHHTRVGFTEELHPRAPPRPRALALSGALVLNAGNVHSLHAAVLAGAKRRMSQDDESLSSEGWQGMIISWVTMEKMFHKCFSFFLNDFLPNP